MNYTDIIISLIIGAIVGFIGGMWFLSDRIDKAITQKEYQSRHGNKS